MQCSLLHGSPGLGTDSIWCVIYYTSVHQTCSDYIEICIYCTPLYFVVRKGFLFRTCWWLVAFCGDLFNCRIGAQVIFHLHSCHHRVFLALLHWQVLRISPAPASAQQLRGFFPLQAVSPLHLRACTLPLDSEACPNTAPSQPATCATCWSTTVTEAIQYR